MIVKFIAWFLSSLAQVTTVFVLRGTAIFLITPTLQLVRTPGIVIGGLLHLIARILCRSWKISKYVVRLIFHVIAFFISGIFKFVSIVVMGIFGHIFEAIMGMMHLPIKGVEDLSGLKPGNFGGLPENGNKLVVLWIIIIILWVLS
jgi:hypothetical protein